MDWKSVGIRIWWQYQYSVSNVKWCFTFLLCSKKHNRVRKCPLRLLRGTDLSPRYLPHSKTWIPKIPSRSNTFPIRNVLSTEVMWDTDPGWRAYCFGLSISSASFLVSLSFSNSAPTFRGAKTSLLEVRGQCHLALALVPTLILWS